jgi:hypothetical protein
MDATIRERVNETFDDRSIGLGLDHVESFGWMSEAHRLSRGVNRSRIGLAAVGTTNGHIQPLIKVSTIRLLQRTARWLAIFKLGTRYRRP